MRRVGIKRNYMEKVIFRLVASTSGFFDCAGSLLLGVGSGEQGLLFIRV